jgi:uncharacterized membrane protein YphA (DoxX/SURF4 family)
VAGEKGGPYFGSPGLPAILAYGVIALELVGGVALILGIYASWFAVPLALVLYLLGDGAMALQPSQRHTN